MTRNFSYQLRGILFWEDFQHYELLLTWEILCRSAFSRHHDDAAANASPSEESEKGMNKHVSVCARRGALGQSEKWFCAPQMLPLPLTSCPWPTAAVNCCPCTGSAPWPQHSDVRPLYVPLQPSPSQKLSEQPYLLLHAHTQIIRVGAHSLFQLPEWELCWPQARWSQRY